MLLYYAETIVLFYNSNHFKLNLSRHKCLILLLMFSFWKQIFSGFNRFRIKASCVSYMGAGFFYREKTQLNQLPIQQGISLKPSRPYIKEQIGTWLSEEIYFLDQRQQLSKPQANDIQDPQAEQKIHTSLSVAHLSVKLLVEAKVITNRNYTELLRIVAKNFKTERNEELSENSLRNKYYSVENGTLRNMKEVLILLNNLVKQYGG